jgi:hypothetical protein
MLVELTGVWATSVGDPTNPVVTAFPIKIPRTSAVTIRVRLVDQLGQPVDPVRVGAVAMTLYIGMPEAPVKQATFTANTALGVNVFDCVLQHTDLQSLFGLLIYDVWATISGVTQQVVATGYWDNGIRVNPS